MCLPFTNKTKKHIYLFFQLNDYANFLSNIQHANKKREWHVYLHDILIKKKGWTLYLRYFGTPFNCFPLTIPRWWPIIFLCVHVMSCCMNCPELLTCLKVKTSQCYLMIMFLEFYYSYALTFLIIDIPIHLYTLTFLYIGIPIHWHSYTFIYINIPIH